MTLTRARCIRTLRTEICHVKSSDEMRRLLYFISSLFPKSCDSVVSTISECIEAISRTAWSKITIVRRNLTVLIERRVWDPFRWIWWIAPIAETDSVLRSLVVLNFFLSILSSASSSAKYTLLWNPTFTIRLPAISIHCDMWSMGSSSMEMTSSLTLLFFFLDRLLPSHLHSISPGS